VLDRVLDERLQQQRRQRDVARVRRDVDRHAQPLLEARLLDVEVRGNQIDLVAQRRELRRRSPQDAAEHARQLHQRVERARRRVLDQIADRRERVEEKVRMELRAQRAQLRLGCEPLHLLFTQVAFDALACDTQPVDAARRRPSHPFE
jgi:hypothetical protein